jgi:hypothetical protein
MTIYKFVFLDNFWGIFFLKLLQFRENEAIMHFRCKLGMSKTVETNCKHKIISQFIIYKPSPIIYTSFIFNILHIIIYIIIRANGSRTIYIYKMIEEENIHCLFAATVKVGSSRLIQPDSDSWCALHYRTCFTLLIGPVCRDQLILTSMIN